LRADEVIESEARMDEIADRVARDRTNAARERTSHPRVGLTFLGTAAFCLLSLLSPDSALLGGSEKINVPFGAYVRRAAARDWDGCKVGR
jgi:hypothetical protein